MQKVTRTVLTRKEAGFKGRTYDFFEIHNKDAHITDVLEDADGSLLVIDTGGWFRKGCPVSQIAKPKIYGSIYRIRKKDTMVLNDPRGLEINWSKISAEELASLLDDNRLAVRDRAIDELVKSKSSEVLPALVKSLKTGSVMARQNVVWTCTRRHSQEDKALLRLALEDRDARVRQAACQGLGFHIDPSAADQLIQIVRTDVPEVQREAAFALGRLRSIDSVKSLMAVLSQPDTDRSLEHALIYALIEINHKENTLKGFLSGSEILKRRTLIAMDQMEDGGLQPGIVLPLLDSQSEDLQRAAVEIAGRHLDWAQEIAELFEIWIKDDPIHERRAKALMEIMPKLISNQTIQSLIGMMLNQWDKNTAVYQLSLDIVTQSNQPDTHHSWIVPFKESLRSNNADLSIRTIDAIAALKGSHFDAELKTISSDLNNPPLLRVKALTAIARKSGSLNSASFDLLTEQLSPENPTYYRSEAARMLGRARLSKPQLLRLANLVGSAGPLELPLLISAFEQSSDKEIGNALVVALEISTGTANIPLSELKRQLINYPLEVYAKARPMVERLAAQSRRQTVQLEEIEASFAKGVPENGKKIFYSQKALCSTCHRIDLDGGQIGPDLTQVGRIRTARDLLESILFPSSSLARDFETYSIETKDGESYTGVILSDSNDSVEIADASGQPIRIARKNIEQIIPSPLSLMPQGLDQAMSKQELSDLISFLTTLK